MSANRLQLKVAKTVFLMWWNDWITAMLFLLDCLHASSIGFGPPLMQQIACIA